VRTTTRDITRRLARGALLAGACVVSVGCDVRGWTGIDVAHAVAEAAPARALTAFASQAELLQFLREQARVARLRFRGGFAQGFSAQPGVVFGHGSMREAAAGLTNVQHAGVDEGDIVKAHGDHLVILRRGRLFTVRLGAGRPAAVSTVDAFAPDIDPRDAWYDEVLVAGDTVAVVGYSYVRGGTELALFDIDARGVLTYRATYHLRSHDYYSSRNYASRLIGRRLILYAPLLLAGGEADPLAALPAIRKWHRGARASEFIPIYSPQRLYRPPSPSPLLTLHTLISCDLGGPEPVCTVTGVMGSPGRVVYVSPAAVYVWMTDDWWSPAPTDPWLFRLPLDGAEPDALRVSGRPVDQFSFLEHAGHLNVVVRSDGTGEGMWQAETARGSVALLRLPLEAFKAMSAVPSSRYRALPSPGDSVFQNRFVGPYLLYGAGDAWGKRAATEASPLFVHDYAADSAPTSIRVGHGVERIEALGKDALVVGSAGRDLELSSIRLGAAPVLAARHVVRDAAQGEWRSHGFFYRTEGNRTGVVGLPLRAAGGAGPAYLTEGSAAVLFLRNDALTLRELGRLHAEPALARADGCRASCVDWYGNARPLFVRDRIFALLGYELVEGALVAGRLEPRHRVDLTPPARDPGR
jgi:hypothetical protein